MITQRLHRIHVLLGSRTVRYLAHAIIQALELGDPRIGNLARTWKEAPSFTDQSEHNASTLGLINHETTAAGYDTKKLAFVDLTAPGPSSNRPLYWFSLTSCHWYAAGSRWRES